MSEKQRQRVALISVTEKENPNIVDFVRQLQALGNWHIIGSAGTCKYLAAAGIKVQDIADMITRSMVQEFVSAGISFKTKRGGRKLSAKAVAKLLDANPMLGHRVVSLSRPKSAGLLARAIDSDLKELAKFGIPFIDMVVCDFYALMRAIEAEGATTESVVEGTDIGGPTMVSEGAKGRRIVICDPADRQMVIDQMREHNGEITEETRNALCAKADFVVSRYRMESARFHSGGHFDGIFMRLARKLAYAENHRQDPAFLFTTDSDDPLATSKFQVVSGDPSYISIADGAGLIGALRFLAEAYRRVYGKVPYIVVAGKHGNVCGIGVDWASPITALRKALTGDKVAVMGGEVVTNFAITDELGVELMSPPLSLLIGRKNWGLDIIYAPSFSPGAVEQLGKREKRRLLSNLALLDPQMPTNEWMWQFLGNGDVLKQKAPSFILTRETIESWVGVPLSDDRFEDLLIAWVACYRSSSNTVALAKNRMLIGLGCGQQDRIACVRLCIERARRAGHTTQGSVFASDAFFPYATGEQPPVDLAQIEWLLAQARSADRVGNQLETIRLLGEMATLISQSDRREGTELLIDAGCIGGVVPADGKEIENVKALFSKSGLSVAFLSSADRLFAKH
ncbi:MAG: hypothetical protein WC508_03175 [Patescibacteria group bacterium]